MEYDTKLGGLFSYKNKSDAASFFAISTLKTELSWICDVGESHRSKRLDYTDVIEDAKVRYKNGEPANYDLTPDPVVLEPADEKYDIHLRLRTNTTIFHFKGTMNDN